MDSFDLCIVGAGVVGLAIAREMAPGRGVLVLDQHETPGQETSSRNSEVIHAGLYYPPGSLKARLCVEGRDLLYRYCSDFDVPHRRCGKFIVAADEERSQLLAIRSNAARNGLELQWLERAELQEAEPLLRADCALFSPDSGIVDSHALMHSLLFQAETRGARFAGLTRVVHIEPTQGGFIVDTLCGPAGQQERYRFACRQLVNSAGLHAQSVAQAIDGLAQESIPPLHLCKGVYFALRGPSPFSHLIYPLPDRHQHGLGVHATLDLSGQVRFGPDTQYVDAADYSVDEGRREAFCQAISRYYPAIRAQDLQPAYAGIRPKLQAEGAAFRDFEIMDGAREGIPGLVQLFGIESPGLTASLALAQRVRELLRAD